MSRKLNDITFQKANGGLGRNAGSDDVISGLVFAGLGLTFGAAAGNLKGFDTAAVDNQNAATAYARKFTYPEQLEDAGIVFTKPGEGSGSNGALSDAEKAKNTLYYHITEFFRMNEAGVLYVMIKAGSATVAAADIATLQTYAGGNIRQIGVFNATLLTVADVKTQCKALEETHRPLCVVLTYSGKEDADLATLKANTNLAVGGQCNVSLLIGCDMDTDLVAALGDYSYYGCIGLCVGAVSKAKVHECIAWVEKFPLGLKTPALFNGLQIRNVATSDLEVLNGNRYIFPVIHAGDADNYFNDSHTLDVDSSDYAYIENVRTIDKACRGIHSKLLPWLNSPLRVDPSSGHLESGTVSFLETTAGEALEEMEKAGEISGYKVEIDPEQNVLATSALEVVIKKVPVGVMRKVTVKIGYTTSL
ncbi:MAG: DUF2586 family protein [Bacteroidales bacterium]|nr:DUF2586 family protein [Bacteroidales bacterium]